jgi:hypothetical protein
MPNWCHSSVRFSGETEKVKAVRDFFMAVDEQQTKFKNYDLPEFVTARNSNIVEIGFGNDQIFFRSAWFPPFQVLVEIADHFEVGFSNKYEESGMFEYGKAYYQNGKYERICLTPEDAAKVTYDAERDVFTYEGHEFDDEYVIIYSMFEKMIAEYEAANPEMVNGVSPAINNEATPEEDEPQKRGLRR